jgi:hypothetical protein
MAVTETKNTKLEKSGRPGSNRPPTAWEAVALPDELLPLKFLIYETCLVGEIFFANQLSFIGMIHLLSNSSFVCTRLLK